MVKQAIKSHLNWFLEPTSTNRWGLSFLLKETTRAFDGVPTHNWPVTSQMLYTLRHEAPQTINEQTLLRVQLTLFQSSGDWDLIKSDGTSSRNMRLKYNNHNIWLDEY